MASSFLRSLDNTQRRITVGRTPLDEWSARRRDLYLTTHNTQNRQTSMPPPGFEPTISAGERPQTYALDRAGTRSWTFPKLEYITEYTRVNLARFIVRHVWFKKFLFLSNFSSRYSVLKHRVSQHTTQRQWTDCGFCLKSPVLTKPVTTSASWFFATSTCHISLPSWLWQYAPLFLLAVSIATAGSRPVLGPPEEPHQGTVACFLHH